MDLKITFFATLLLAECLIQPAAYGQQDTVRGGTLFPEIASPAERPSRQDTPPQERIATPPPPAAQKSVLFVNADTVLDGPSPLDTTRNSENKFLSDFYDTHFPTRGLEALTDWKAWQTSDRDAGLEYRMRKARDGWLLTVLMLMVFLAAMILRYYRKDVIVLLKNLVNLRPKTQSPRDQHILHIPAFLILLALFGLISGLVVYLGVQDGGLSLPYRGAELFFLLSGMSILLYLLKVALLKAAAFIFRIKDIMQAYLDIFHTVMLGFSCFALPILILHILGPPQLGTLTLYLLIAFSVFSLLYSYGRAAVHTLSAFPFPKIYLITYLCAFEICPILILIKFFS